MVDLDVYFFKNPLPYILQPQFHEYDLLIRQVFKYYNTGFYLARSRPVRDQVYLFIKAYFLFSWIAFPATLWFWITKK